MSDINSSLIGFLKKKSLFSTSPDRNTRRKDKSKERSIQGSVNIMTPRNDPKQENSLRMYNTQSSKNLHKDASTKNMMNMDNDFDNDMNLLEQQNPIRYFNNQKKEIKNSVKPIRRNFNFKNPQQYRQQQTIKVQSKTTNNNKNNTNIWASLVSHSMSFQSARVESKQCLDSLSNKLQTQISNINYKLDVFHSKMTTLLNHQFQNLHGQIISIVEKVFMQSEAHIRAYIKEQEEILGAELLDMRVKLRNQYEKVQLMKDEINKPNWKKVAGELLSSGLDDKVDHLIAKSKGLDMGHWEIGDLGASKVKALQFQLRQMVTLST